MMVAGKRKSAVVMAAACCLGGLLVWFGYAAWHAERTDARPDNTVVAEVDGEPVTEEEFRWALGRERTAVIEQFKRKRGAVVDEEFWQREYDGATPLETVKKRAMDTAVRLKVQLRLAERYGLIADASYEGVLLEMERENVRMEEALAAGLPVYGPARFEADDFVDFYLGRLAVELKDRLLENELAVTDEKLKRHYEEVKGELFRQEGETRFYAFSAAYRRGGVEEKGLKREAAAAIEEASRRLAAGESVGAIAAEWNAGERSGEDSEGASAAQGGTTGTPDIADAGPLLQAAEESFDAESARYYYRALPPLYDLLARQPESGLIGPVIDDAANGRYVLAVVIGSKEGSYAGFEESKAIVRQHYAEFAYADYVNRLAKNARVVTVDEVYDDLTMN
ncbi:hypothetical protein [Paenibacillus soyae]|uniref:Uncharacterized protein n=1 Tax=Paenibacillus soyae TaxID=2969249 RepID=A0A9X2MWG0_9BACL|nr:hypothetical protein [Paenibacillus soyae]MCR2807587.1 hypothetical protein [Paenibacillus soyae]